MRALSLSCPIVQQVLKLHQGLQEHQGILEWALSQGYERAALSVPPPSLWPLLAGVHGLRSCSGKGWEGVPGLRIIGECNAYNGRGCAMCHAFGVAP